MLLLILLILLALVLFGGGAWVTPRYGPYVSYSPLTVVVIIIIVCWLLGVFR